MPFGNRMETLSEHQKVKSYQIFEGLTALLLSSKRLTVFVPRGKQRAKGSGAGRKKLIGTAKAGGRSVGFRI